MESGLPGKLVNLRVSDLSYLKQAQCYELHVRDEISKTFGRRFKLLLSSDLIAEYLRQSDRNDQDYLFSH